MTIAALLACGTQAERGDASGAASSGPDSIPTITEAACEGEACQAEYRAVACTNVMLVVSPSNGAGAAILQPGDTVDVRSDLHLKTPGVVVMKVDHTVPDDWNMGSGSSEPPPLRFASGDTLLLLNYIGEGFWKASHKGRHMEVLEFWGGPGEAERGPLDSAQSAIATGSAPVIDTWLAIKRGGQVIGWVKRDTTRSIAAVGEYGEQRGERCSGLR
jgi:hypothetical protein